MVSDICLFSLVAEIENLTKTRIASRSPLGRAAYGILERQECCDQPHPNERLLRRSGSEKGV